MPHHGAPASIKSRLVMTDTVEAPRGNTCSWQGMHRERHLPNLPNREWHLPNREWHLPNREWHLPHREWHLPN
eukprot:7391550-Prymnesium_polylepis.1